MSTFRFRATVVAVTVAVTAALLLGAWALVIGPKLKIRSESAAAVLSSRASAAAATGAASAPTVLTVPPNPSVLVLGDSWAAGWGSDDDRGGYIAEAFQTLGWTRTEIVAVGGIGYLNPGDDAGDYQDQVDALGALPFGDPDLIIVQGSTNDAAVEYAGLPEAADTLFDSLHLRWPGAQLLMLAGCPEEAPADPAVLEVNALLTTVAVERQIPIIDPARENWITVDNIDEYVDVTGHPNDEGHEYLAGRLVTDLRRLMAG